jgi:hypothetical protein
MEIPDIVWVLAAFIGLVLLFAALKLFAIANTLTAILEELRKSNAAPEVPYFKHEGSAAP